MILPEFWCLRITEETSEVINAWRREQRPGHGDCPYPYICEDAWGLQANIIDNTPAISVDSDRIEITFQEFKRYVLFINEEEINKEEEILFNLLKECNNGKY